MKEYKIVYCGGEGEIVEKKSRFIATVKPVDSEEEASAFIAEMKKKYWDARHNCSAFVIGDRQEMSRCSDDGEPAQTAGQLAVRTELYAKKDSRIRLVQVMMRGEGQELLNDVGCICEKNGALDLLQVVVGKGDVYDGIWIELQKDHASLQAEIGYLLQNQQKFDVNLNVRHFGKVTESTIQAVGTLMDAAEKIFRGTIDFVRGSADSVGAETEQVLLLGDDVVNKTIPVILCAEENVQGSHGAAIGELDEETLFYFGARGMDRTQAENTMARAKLEAKIQKIGDADIEQKVKTQLAEVLDRDNR